MDVITVKGQAREPGKKGARAARRIKEVPCILYGHNIAPVVFQVPEVSLNPLIYTDAFHRVTITVEDESWDCLLKQIDFHPVTDRPIHVDFQILLSGEIITLAVPVQYRGTPVGKREGGRLQTFFNELEITCMPKDIPDHIDIDISELAIGDVIRIADLDFEKIKFEMAPEQTVVMVAQPREEVEEEEEESMLEGEDMEAEENDAEE